MSKRLDRWFNRIELMCCTLLFISLVLWKIALIWFMIIMLFALAP